MRIGILGAGQLGRMLALAGYPLDHQCVFYDLSGSPSAGIGEIIDDPDGSRLDEFLDKVDRVTYEFEHLPLEVVRQIADQKPLFPGVKSLAVCQNRAEEKALFERLSIPTAAYRLVSTAEELAEAAESLGCPVVAKSVTEGYDGKGQAVIRDPREASGAWERIGHKMLLVEAFVDFSRELSIIAARGQDGEVAIYPMAENVHVDGILRYSFAPAPNLCTEVAAEAEAFIKMLLDELGHVGVLTLELFETPDGLMANEMAPRVHNSGHWSIEGATTSQFENHLRAVAGLPLGDTVAHRPTCMINIIGKAGNDEDLLRLPYAHLHRYGKAEREGRKIGHVTVQADSYEELVWRVRNCASLLPGTPELSCSLTRK
ncbi:5-(carboxyamino)imidazole ribonucleotide synthase [Hydrocarboniclastica marina]|uniref:N5-carboxyaminoimidazole ribonucleotide synthase n=1 Tax=Hydrocarboniclastica marina TaxID=2259620 RepID=A0A4P7XI64_9ALTE|nr:5-(carboxyamino)imidazole ribonucleotide synthase [Hydrocarboniclastica marina]MAM00548.1 5-(carboxyamino)imidazole ribonucleotide synthase [Alteromonadaceae bacterium]QCF26415.1 5-(carboxyamino)imidazole ribonucleotide synthase [Hydrocarboniclastica marina]